MTETKDAIIRLCREDIQRIKANLDLEGDQFERVFDRCLEVLWNEFSRIQCASFIFVKDESVKRFGEWLESGDDEDAWS